MSSVVSVIVPVYNTDEHLVRCLESLVGQTYPQLEIIVVDDGSTDGSPEVIAAFANQDERIKAIHQANAGVSAARNTGIDAATGEYVTFMDADDWLELPAIQTMVEKLESQGLDFISCGYTIDFPEHIVNGPTHPRFGGRLDTHGGLESVLATRHRFAVTRVFRRSLIGPVRFRNDIHWGEDTLFVLEVAKRAQSSSVIPEHFYHYIQSEGSATRSKINPKRLTGPAMTQVMEELVADEYPDLVPYVLQTRVNTLSILIDDALHTRSVETPQQLREFTKLLRSDLSRVLRAKPIPAKTKIKALAISVAPRSYTAARNALSTLRSKNAS